MQSVALTSPIDLTLLLFWGFVIFFVGLVWYLHREDKREGYPLENAVTGEVQRDGWLFMPPPKTFHLHGGKTVTVPNMTRDTRLVKAAPTARFPGAPLEPTGNPLTDAVGPASYAERADTPDMTHSGAVKIVPLRTAEGYAVDANDPDPVGMNVVGCDRKVAGKVVDVWVDRAEHVVRYLEVDVTGAGRTVLLPINFTLFKRSPERIYVHALTAGQFANVPALKNPNQVTFLEEDKITGYYGGGHLYATPQRAEPIL